MGARTSTTVRAGAEASDVPYVARVPPVLVPVPVPVPINSRPSVTPNTKLSATVFRAVTPCGSPLFSAYREAQLYCRRVDELDHVERITVHGATPLEPAVWVVMYNRETDFGDEARELGMYASEAAARVAATTRAYTHVYRVRVYDKATDAPGERVVYSIYNTRFT